MTRLLGVTSACVLAGAIAMSAQQTVPNRGSGAGKAKPGQQASQNQELKQAREDLQHDVAEGKRLQQQLKLDQRSGDKDAIKHDNAALKDNRDKVKKDQDHIKQLTGGRGRGNA
jgi:hypothetical protein